MGWLGELLTIQIAPSKGATPLIVETADVTVAGIAGDRYATGAGKSPGKAGIPKKAVTLIAEETLTDIAFEYGITVQHHTTRRNLLTKNST